MSEKAIGRWGRKNRHTKKKTEEKNSVKLHSEKMIPFFGTLDQVGTSSVVTEVFNPSLTSIPLLPHLERAGLRPRDLAGDNI